MLNKLLLTLCCLSIVVIAGLGYSLTNTNQALQSSRDAHENLEAQLLSQVEMNTRQRLQFEQQLESLEDRSLALQAQIASLQTALREALANADPDIEAIRQQARREAESSQNGGGNLLSSAMRSFTQGDNGRRMARIQVTTQYEEFLQQLDVDEMTRDEIREALIEATAERMRQAMAGLTSDQAEPDGNSADRGDPLMDTMAQMLTGEQYEQFEQYQGSMVQRTLRTAYGSQLDMMAPRLSTEARATVLEVVVEEFAATQEPSAGLPGDLNSIADRQLNALYQAQNRLSQVLSVEEMQQSEGFFSQIEMSLDMLQDIQSDISNAQRQ